MLFRNERNAEHFAHFGREQIGCAMRAINISPLRGCFSDRLHRAQRSWSDRVGYVTRSEKLRLSPASEAHLEQRAQTRFVGISAASRRSSLRRLLSGRLRIFELQSVRRLPLAMW